MQASLQELREHAGSFASISVFALGNASTPEHAKVSWVHEVTHTLGIETYKLGCGALPFDDLTSFYTSAARKITVEACVATAVNGSYTGIDLDYEHMPVRNATVTAAYSAFVRSLSAALHAAGKKLSCCVGSYPTPENGIQVFYDPAVLNETMDVVRVMNYDMYWVGGRGVPSLAARPDCVGAGPTSTQPWAKQSMQWWLARIARAKLVMGLPAYSNDYCSLPHCGGGNGTQIYASGPPTTPGEAVAGSVETAWQFFEQIYVHRYTSAKTGQPRIRYGTDVRSTRAHLATADELGVSQVGFWTWLSADARMKSAVFAWTQPVV
eukprot:g901.t1